MKTIENEFVVIAEGKSSETCLQEFNRIDINLTQLRKNVDILRNGLNPGVKFMAVVKGDAYGHGLVPIAQELEKCKCDAIGVVRLTEAVALREGKIKIPVVILAPLMPSQCQWVVEHNISVMVDNEKIVSALDKQAASKNKVVDVHIKVNTGLNRYGIETDEVVRFIHMINEKYLHINIKGIYTHFKDPEYNEQFTYDQMMKFNEVLKKLEEVNLRPPIAHAAGSAGILMYPESHYDMVRCGLILYGLEHKPDEKMLPEGVRPIMSVKSKIIKLDKVKANASAGYGDSFIAKRDSVVAVVGIGYGDGISRGWKEVLIAGKKVPVVNYFMDGMLVDVTDIKEEVKEFDEVVIIGKQGDESISWEDACQSMNSYMDEQFQRITERVPKHYFIYK
ncbi:alanine racemase [Clostridium beijerinckii]|uniref:alanine racemase n=1 Tax=Clostridium beijerinckii TaxID=1520 RepID=UPI00098CB01C|nr:alanine racemase [Clostridium beijerinckii]NRT76008.1 alanine racemase [Clostridium beijerinckii]OOM48360.1 alanine racemase [Clostridium beijerinckii]